MVTVARPRLPRRLHLELTNRCNSQCQTCIRTATPAPDCDMPLAEVRRIVDEIPDLESVALQVNGEPLLYPDLAQVVHLLVDRGVVVELNTNGIALDGDRARALLDSGLQRLNVSLDAASPATYQALRGVAALERVVANVHRFLRRRGPPPAFPRVSLWVTSTRHNLCELPRIIDIAAHVGADEVFLQRLVYFGQGKASAHDSVHDQLTDAHREALAEAVRRAERLGIAFRACGGHTPRDMLTATGDSDAWRECRRPNESTVILANGDVVPCCICTFVAPLERIRMGNVRRERLASVWNGPRYTELRAEHARGAGPDYCTSCGVRWSM